MKVLVAGVGSVGQRHIRNLRALMGSDVDIGAYRVRRLRGVLTDAKTIQPDGDVEEIYGLTVYEDLELALGSRPDAIFVCNPTSGHIPVALQAARAGCHLFIEKPLSNGCDGVQALIQAVNRQGLVAMVGYQMRFHPGLQRVRELLTQQLVGSIVSVRAEVGEHLPAAHPYEDYRVSYAGRAELGGGVILSQSHELDYLHWLFGLPERIFSVGGRLTSLQIDVEDTAITLMEYIVDGRKVPVQLSQDFVQQPAARTLHIVGDSGKIVLDLAGGTLDVFGSGGGVVESHSFADLPRNQLFVDELTHFLSCLEGEKQPSPTLEEAAGTLRLGLAVRQALESGQVVSLK